MDSDTSFAADLAALAWQVELGVDTTVGEVPVNRYDAPRVPEASPVAAPAAVAAGDEPSAVEDAARAAAMAQDLPGLRAALQAYEHCELKRGAKSLVFSDGLPGARVMVIGEAPGRDEDQEGRPFVGRAGQLLDRMFAAIGLSRGASDPAAALYITNVMVWRPPQNREPTPEEAAMMLPFLHRHIALARPGVLVLMGNTPLSALLGQKGITRLRGQWQTVLGLPVLPMLHPAYLLRTPSAKREAWADFLSLKARLRTTP
jgi:uracil-DNA glycosylase family 4